MISSDLVSIEVASVTTLVMSDMSSTGADEFLRTLPNKVSEFRSFPKTSSSSVRTSCLFTILVMRSSLRMMRSTLSKMTCLIRFWLYASMPSLSSKC